MLVDFVVAGGGIMIDEDFVAAPGMSEEAEVPAWVIATMADPAAHEKEAAIEVITVERGSVEGALDFLGQVW